MKKIILTIILFGSIFSIYWYFKNVNGWIDFQKKTSTPREFLNHSSIKKEYYLRDKIELKRQFKLLLLKREGFFDNSAYSDSMDLIIDSILYSSDFNKMAVFVIVKNLTKRQLVPDNENTWYYDATSYLGIRQGNTISLTWKGPVFTNSSSESDISVDIREACFNNFVTKDTTDIYEFNLNDIRFWSSSIWKEIEYEKIKKQRFEEEKRRHPENIYESKVQ